jgi:pyruvate dehydrogenase E1 component
VWSATSFTELRRDGIEVERWNRLHPTEEARVPYVHEALGERTGPFVAATDYIRSFADQIREWVPGRYTVLGTDGFGRSDYRRQLRRFFEVDRHHVAVAALDALAREDKVKRKVVAQAIEKYGIDTESDAPWLR